RVNFVSAFFGAAAVAMTYLCGRELKLGRAAPWLAAMALAVSGVLWSQAVIAEVYTLNAFLMALALWLALRWRDDRRRGWLWALSLTVGLGMTNHHLLALAAAPLAVWVLAVDWRAALRPATAAGCVALLLAGLSVYAYLPLRARANPPVNWNNPATLAGVIHHIRRDVYAVGEEKIRQSGGAKDLARHVGHAALASAGALGWPLAALALAGAVLMARRRRGVLLLTAAIALLNTAVLNAILKEPYSPSWAYVHDVYYIPAHMMAALWLAWGAEAALAWGARAGRPWRAAVAAALALCVAGTAAWHWRANDRGRDWLARRFAVDLLNSIPRGGGLLALTDEGTFPVVYMQVVEGARPDVQIISDMFGWHGQPISSVFCEVPVEPHMIPHLPPAFRRDLVSVPHGLGFLLRLPTAGLDASWNALQPLPAVHWPAPPRPGFDPFTQYVRGLYAGYAARLGARELAAGRREAGEQALVRAAEFKGDDPYANWLLAVVYGRFGLRPEEVRPLLRRALTLYDRQIDAVTARYYPLSRPMILQSLQASGAN
ncbi:MAG: DUF2723 domain-containing protein, partial [bacterium]|nr:DUF2723 domain-containing protein [bacterium]